MPTNLPSHIQSLIAMYAHPVHPCKTQIITFDKTTLSPMVTNAELDRATSLWKDWCRVQVRTNLVRMDWQFLDRVRPIQERYHPLLHRALRTNEHLSDEEKQEGMDFMLDDRRDVYNALVSDYYYFEDFCDSHLEFVDAKKYTVLSYFEHCFRVDGYTY